MGAKTKISKKIFTCVFAFARSEHNMNMENQTFGMETYASKGNGSHHLERSLARDEALATTNNIGLYSIMIISPMGVLLNVLAIIVLVKIKNYKTSTGLLLVCITIGDICVLIGMSVTRIFVFNSSFNVMFNSYAVKLILCKGGPLVLNTGLVWSALLLTSVTIERFICITFVLKVKKWNLLKISRRLIVVYLILSVSLAIGQTYRVIIADENSDVPCHLNLTDGIVGVIDTIVNTVIVNGICSGLILIFTIAIAFKLYQSKRERNTLNDNNSNCVTGNKEIKITLMIFIVATVFILTRLPPFVLYEMQKYFFSKRMYFNKHYLNIVAASPLCYALIIVNHSINFIVYMCFLEHFRDGFRKCFSRKQNTVMER